LLVSGCYGQLVWLSGFEDGELVGSLLLITFKWPNGETWPYLTFLLLKKLFLQTCKCSIQSNCSSFSWKRKYSNLRELIDCNFFSAFASSSLWQSCLQTFQLIPVSEAQHKCVLVGCVPIGCFHVTALLCQVKLNLLI